MNTHPLMTIVLALTSSCAAQDFNGDGADDLIVGVPGDRFGDLAVSGGSINVVYGEPLLGLNRLGFPRGTTPAPELTGHARKG